MPMEMVCSSLPSPAEPPIVTSAAMGGRSREWKAGFSLPFPVVSPEAGRPRCFWSPSPEARQRTTDRHCRSSPGRERPGTWLAHSSPILRVTKGVDIVQEAPACDWRKNAPKRHGYRQRGQNGLTQRFLVRLRRFFCGSARETGDLVFPAEP